MSILVESEKLAGSKSVWTAVRALDVVRLHDLLAAAGAERKRQPDSQPEHRRGCRQPRSNATNATHCCCSAGLHARQQPLVLLAELLLVLRAHLELDRLDLLLLAIEVGVRDPHLFALQLGERRAVEARACGRRRRAGRHTGPDDRLEALLEVAVDLVGLLVAVALVQHARGPLLGRLHHPLVLDDALVELVELLDQGREHRRSSEGGLAGVLRAAAELGEVTRVDRLREGDARVVASERAVVRGSVGRRKRGANPRVGVGLLVSLAEHGADAVAELPRELLVGDACLARHGLLLGERVDRDVVEALCLHAVADPVLDPGLDLLGAVAAPEAERVLQLLRRLVRLLLAATGADEHRCEKHQRQDQEMPHLHEVPSFQHGHGSTIDKKVQLVAFKWLTARLKPCRPAEPRQAPSRQRATRDRFRIAARSARRQGARPAGSWGRAQGSRCGSRPRPRPRGSRGWCR